jgi:hypothetical protein
MPKLWEFGPYRFFFYSADCSEPPHVHMERERMVAKFWLDPVRLERSGRFSRSEINKIQRLIEREQVRLMRGWNEHCG